jgi:hypothetical protein
MGDRRFLTGLRDSANPVSFVWQVLYNRWRTTLTLKVTTLCFVGRVSRDLYLNFQPFPYDAV